MKWLLSLLCFTTITAFSQADKPLLEKLKKTQERLKGSSPNTIPNQGLGLEQRIQRPSNIQGQKSHQLTIIPPMTIMPPKTERRRPGSIPNVSPQFQYKPRIIDANEQRIVIALSQDNMPCIVPNMKLVKAMPNAGDKSMLERPTDPGIYLQKPKS